MCLMSRRRYEAEGQVEQFEMNKVVHERNEKGGRGSFLGSGKSCHSRCRAVEQAWRRWRGVVTG